MTPRYVSVVLDVDSTLAGIEGIDVLARRAGPVVAEEIATLTRRAMAGEIPLERIYGARLGVIQPTQADIAHLAEAYIESLAPGAAAAITHMQNAGVRVVLVSGGIREAIQPLAAELGLDDELFAVSVRFDADGRYVGYDEASPLAAQGGKPLVVRSLALPHRILAVGDGSTDAAMRPVVDAFAAFTGFATRPPVVAAADIVISSFDELLATVLP